ncbi:hypothetical protein ASPCAL10813 [Aspergillus calidoustus]|uniref:C3H1-type domain-containing protein n=1 Tax=Aspergillus calidoustus TaxID=454130 RepID=A0A0U5CD75_ASPCI|nr:hypothetical protein ASPCAL10813 [Aspergillus calidoustus]
MDPVNPASLPSEYWSSLDPYANPDSSHHHSHPPQQQSTPQQTQQQQPMGISWDHPVLHSQPSHRDQSHGLYQTPSPQSWQQNPLHHQPIAPATPQNLGIPAQYRQVPQYAQGQVTFDSRAVPAPENSHYQSYSYPSNFYPPQHLSIPDPFPQSHSPQPTQQQSQSASYPPLHQSSVPQYTIPSGFADEQPQSSINFANEFVQQPPSLSEQTINPQYINPQQPVNQNPSLHNQFVYVNPAEDPKMFSYFPDNLQMHPMMGQPAINGSLVPGQPAINGSLVPGQPSKVGGVPINGLKSIPANAMAKVAPLRAKPAGTKKQTQTAKAPLKAGSKKTNGKGSVSSDSESDYSDDSDLEIQEPEEPSPLPPARPNEPEAAIQYDCLQAVWYPRNRRPKVDKLKAAIVAFKDVVKTVRDAWRESSQALKTAENKGESNETAELRKQVALQRRLMDVVVSTTLEKGHPMIVEKLGEHPMAVAALYSFLVDRHQASDIDGTLTVNILKLLARFVTMDEEALTKTNVAKLLPRFVKKGNQVVKTLAQNILDNAAASTKRKQEAAKPGPKESSPNKNAVVNGARKDTTGAKRPLDGEQNGQPATKRVVVTSNIKPATKAGSLAANGAAKPENKSVTTTANSARPKANIVAPKPTNLFGSLTSASKKPGTSNAERAAAAAAAKSGTPAEKKEAAARPAFSFGDIMADLNKQKDPSPRESSENQTPETEEERAKRLRKEARRKLRVTWKPDESLTEVRLFTHDPDEELGPGDRSRQGGDVKGEGSVLKLHKNIDELEEDDEAGVKEEQFAEYYVPSEIDIDNVSPDDRARSYIKRAGILIATSPEAKAQEHREATTLMAIYTSPADVPPSAKEPPPPDMDEMVPEVLSFGELPDHVKARQEKYFAMTNPQKPPTPQSQPPQNNQFVLNLLNSIQNPSHPHTSTPPVASQPAPISLEQTINMLRQQQPNNPPAPPPMPQPNIDSRLLAMLYPGQQQPPQPQPQPQQGGIPANLAAIISQLTNQTQQNQQPAQPEVTQTHTTGHYEDPERKRMRESGGYDGEDRWKRNRTGGAPNKKHPKAGLVPCRYWREGKCLKGDNCTFRHDPF